MYCRRSRSRSAQSNDRVGAGAARGSGERIRPHGILGGSLRSRQSVGAVSLNTLPALRFYFGRDRVPIICRPSSDRYFYIVQILSQLKLYCLIYLLLCLCVYATRSTKDPS